MFRNIALSTLVILGTASGALAATKHHHRVPASAYSSFASVRMTTPVHQSGAEYIQSRGYSEYVVGVAPAHN
jgi:hypothetical protein